MAEEAIITAGEQENKTQAPSDSAESKANDSKAETVGEVLSSQSQEKNDESVPLAKFLEIKKENKQLANQMKELQKSIEAGTPKKEVTSDLKALAEKHDIDATFLQEFADAVRANAEKETEEKINSKLKPLQDKEKSERIEKVFAEHYKKTLDEMPEYEGVVNREVIKQLSLNPANANKTFAQLIEESYGHVVTGKRSLDPASSRTGKNDNLDVDVEKAKRDPAYFKEVMDNPVLKKKYNDDLTSRTSRFL